MADLSGHTACPRWRYLRGAYRALSARWRGGSRAAQGGLGVENGAEGRRRTKLDVAEVVLTRAAAPKLKRRSRSHSCITTMAWGSWMITRSQIDMRCSWRLALDASRAIKQALLLGRGPVLTSPTCHPPLLSAWSPCTTQHTAASHLKPAHAMHGPSPRDSQRVRSC